MRFLNESTRGLKAPQPCRYVPSWYRMIHALVTKTPIDLNIACPTNSIMCSDADNTSLSHGHRHAYLEHDNLKDPGVRSGFHDSRSAVVSSLQAGRPM
jgi:hypothetical protein